MTTEFTIAKPSPRLDKYVAEQCGLSRSYTQKLIESGQITVNGRQAKPSSELLPGDRVRVSLPPPATTALRPEALPLKVIYEDEDLLVVDKPPGLPVHPAPGHPAGTLVNALLAHCPDLAGIRGSLRPGIVHRLDKDTSGLMVVAKNDAAQTALSQQIKERSLTKKYLALVVGCLTPERGAIEAPIGRDPRNRKRMAVVSRGREARTHYRVISYIGDHTLIEVTPETGRTHQIRVHFSATGHPLLADPLYGKRSPVLGRQFLHAHRLGFRLPSTGQYVEFTSELPPDLDEVLAALSRQGS